MVVIVGQSSNAPEAAQSYLAEADEGLLGLVEVLRGACMLSQQ